MLCSQLFLLAMLMTGSDTTNTSADTLWYELPKSVMITATRQPDSLHKIPLAVSLISKDHLSRVRGYGLDEALYTVPGVLAQSRYGNQDVRITIRGFGARGAGERSNAGTSRGIRVLLDGFPETEPDGRTAFDLIDLNAAGSIEIVRSNASSVWGNAGGGVLQVLSNTSFSYPFVSYQSTLGDFGYRKEVLQSGSLIGSGKYFLTLTNTNYDGWRGHSASTRSLLNTGIVTPLGSRTDLGVYLTVASNLFKIPGPLTQSQFDSDPSQGQNDTSNYNPTYVQRDERRRNRQGRIGVTIKHKLNATQQFSASAFAAPKYLQRSERNTFRDFTRYHIGGNVSFAQSYALSPSSTGTLLLGADEAYQDGAILFYSLANGERGTTVRDDKREGANNLGLFAQSSTDFGAAWTLLLGARYDRITYYYENFLNPKLGDSRAFQRVTPKAGLSYRISPLHSVYVNLGGGVEVPAGNETDPAGTFGQDTVTSLNPLLDPITSSTIELGTRQQWQPESESFLRQFSYELSVYNINVKNDIVPYSGGRYYFTSGETERRGAELSLGLSLRGGISFSSSVTMSRSKYESYTVDSVHYGVPGHTADYADNKMAGAPEFYYATSVRYSPMSSRILSVELGAQGIGKYFADDANSVIVPSYDIFRAGLSVSHLNLFQKQLYLSGSLYVNNLTDEIYVASAFINPDRNRTTGAPIYIEPGLPRNVASSISLNWEF